MSDERPETSKQFVTVLDNLDALFTGDPGASEQTRNIKMLTSLIPGLSPTEDMWKTAERTVDFDTMHNVFSVYFHQDASNPRIGVSMSVTARKPSGYESEPKNVRVSITHESERDVLSMTLVYSPEGTFLRGEVGFGKADDGGRSMRSSDTFDFDATGLVTRNDIGLGILTVDKTMIDVASTLGKVIAPDDLHETPELDDFIKLASSKI